MRVSRRDFIYGASGTVATSLLLPNGAARADAYDALRLRWRDILLGTGYDPNAEPYDSILSAIGTEALDHLSAMRNGTWSDIALTSSDSGRVTSHMSRLYSMAQAYSLPNTGFTGDSAMMTGILTGLNYITSDPLGYMNCGTTYDNWWHWYIGAPQRLVNILSLVFDRLSTTQLQYFLAPIDYFIVGDIDNRIGRADGSEAINISKSLILRGILGRESGPIEEGLALTSNRIPFVSSGDGFYADGSFIQHDKVPYNGTYGAAMLGGTADLIALLRGSSWQLSDQLQQNAFQWVEHSFAPFIYHGLVMDGVAGRSIAREEHDHQRARGIMLSILLLGESDRVTPAMRLRWKGIVKGWLQRDTWYPLAANPIESIPDIVRVTAMMNDASIAPIEEPIGNRVFGRMDRATHRRANWAIAISMSSTRTCFYENNNGENMRGWHTNSGMTYCWGRDFGKGHYSDVYWPIVNPYRLAGTTVAWKGNLQNGAGGYRPSPTNAWAGGASNGELAVVGQDTRGLLAPTLRAYKSWFCLGDMVVCLGAGISCSDGEKVETTVENRNLGSGGATQAFIVNGVSQPVNLGWSVTLSAVKWAHLSNMGGYVFIDSGGATLKAERTEQAGRWSDIKNGADTTLHKRKFLTLLYEHGTNPEQARYAYALMPGATVAETKARSDAGKGQLSVLSNSSSLQAISTAAGFVGANVWSASPAKPVTVEATTVDGRCSVLVNSPGDGSTEIVLADPTQAATAPIIVKWVGTVKRIDPVPSGVTVLSTQPLKLSFDLVGKRGASLRFKCWNF